MSLSGNNHTHPSRSLTWPTRQNITRQSLQDLHGSRPSNDNQVPLSDLQPTASSSMSHLLTQQASESESEPDDAQDGQQQTPIQGYSTCKVGRRGWKWKYLIKNPSSEEPYRLLDNWSTLTRIMVLRLVGITIVTVAIVLGAIGQSFDLSSGISASLGVDEDLQLTFIGLINRVLEMLTQDALSHIALTILTAWMIRPGSRGASSSDMEMMEEFKQPWIALINFFERRKSESKGGRSWSNWVRLFISLAFGMSLLLIGAAMNTVVIPKTRWWPDTRFEHPQISDNRFYFENQTSRVSSVSRMSIWQQAWEMIRIGGDISWEVAHSMAASRSQTALGKVYDTFNQDAGWQSLGNNQIEYFTAVNVTNASTASMQTMAVHGGLAADMYKEQSSTSSHDWAKYSSGWSATLYIPGILLDTTCFAINRTSIGSWTLSTNENATIELQIGPYASNNSFTGVECLISIRNAWIKLHHWLYDGTGDYDYSVNNWGKEGWSNVSMISHYDDNYDMASEGTGWFQDFLPNLQNFTTSPQTVNLTSLVTTIADSLVSLNRGYSQTLAISAVLGVIFADMFTSFEWTYTDISGKTAYQGPVSWQIYGSGPRLPWEWTISIVLGVVLVVHFYDLGLLLRYKGLACGHWLTLGGMMQTANSSPQFNDDSDTDSSGGSRKSHSKSIHLFVREDKDLEDQTSGKLVLLGEKRLNQQQLTVGNQYIEIQEGKEYSKQPQH